MKKVFKILLAILAPVWLAFSCAHASEVTSEEETETGTQQEINFTEDNLNANFIYKYSIVNSQNQTVTGTNYNYNIALRSSTNQTVAYRGGSIYPNAYQVFDSGTTPQDPNLKNLSFITDANLYGANYSNAPNMTVSNTQFEVLAELPDNLQGMYYCGVDFYIGFVCSNTYLRPGSAYQSSRTITTSCTVDSEPWTYTDVYGHEIMFYPLNDVSYTVDASSGGINNIMTYNLKHFRGYFDGAITNPEEPIDFNFTAYFVDHIGTFTGSGVYANGWEGQNPYYLNAFFEISGEYYGSIPTPSPSPTPSPTPSPNEDIINNNNNNTTNIITNINNGFDKLTVVLEGLIYGLTDLIFGKPADWIDFFSGVQEDMEDHLPVVKFLQELKNIFGNFFNIESTDPTALQFVAGWQSDIYTLHIDALPLVLPDGEHPFFPEVNFNLNNPLMNEIRPYWLTFSNVLITLLFIRFLANYLFRWTQLLTGDTSVAFQLFHQSPDELENLGTDPYDLAGDYSYDPVDSANHDLYQDAEAHYGHGAARYLSKVFHGK